MRNPHSQQYVLVGPTCSPSARGECNEARNRRVGSKSARKVGRHELQRARSEGRARVAPLLERAPRFGHVRSLPREAARPQTRMIRIEAQTSPLEAAVVKKGCAAARD